MHVADLEVVNPSDHGEIRVDHWARMRLYTAFRIELKALR